MKKAITILAVLIVLVSAVFADNTETHKIKLTTQVVEYKPVFQLFFSNAVKTNDTRANGRTNPNVAEGEDFSTTTYWNEADVIDKTDVDISQASITATVTAKLTGNVKLAAVNTYNLEFKADSLKSDHTHVTEEEGAAAYYYIAPTTTGSTIVAASGNDLDDGITMGEPSELAVSNGTLSGDIDAIMDTSNIQPCNLASFTFVYPENDGAPVDTYEAFIWMIVSGS